MTQFFLKKCPNFWLGRAIWAEFRPRWAGSLKNVWSHCQSLTFEFLTCIQDLLSKMSSKKINDENVSPGPGVKKLNTPERRGSSSSPLQILRNFASLSNRGSPSPLKTPFGKLFRKVMNFRLSLLIF